MSDAITRPLAALMAGLHPTWQIPGCAAAIHAARNIAPLDQLAHAVIAYAMRTDVTTPALLAQDGPHWHTGRTPNTRVEPARCAKYGHESYAAYNCSACRTADLEPSSTPAERVPSVSAERVRAILDAALDEPRRTPDAAELASGDTR